MYLAEDRVCIRVTIDLFYALTLRRFFAGSSFPNVAAHGYCTTSSPLMQLQTCPTKFPNLYHNGVAGLTAHSLLQYTV